MKVETNERGEDVSEERMCWRQVRSAWREALCAWREQTSNVSALEVSSERLERGYVDTTMSSRVRLRCHAWREQTSEERM